MARAPPTSHLVTRHSQHTVQSAAATYWFSNYRRCRLACRRGAAAAAATTGAAAPPPTAIGPPSRKASRMHQLFCSRRACSNRRCHLISHHWELRSEPRTSHSHAVPGTCRGAPWRHQRSDQAIGGPKGFAPVLACGSFALNSASNVFATHASQPAVQLVLPSARDQYSPWPPTARMR
jgi:hypothetical protein